MQSAKLNLIIFFYLQTEYDEIAANQYLSQKESEEVRRIDIKTMNKSKNKKKSLQKKNKKPGLVHIATALDGTTLFCCPECQMAYSEKSCLEKHLLLHKIERR